MNETQPRNPDIRETIGLSFFSLPAIVLKEGMEMDYIKTINFDNRKDGR